MVIVACCGLRSGSALLCVGVRGDAVVRHGSWIPILKEAKVERYGQRFAGSMGVLRVCGCEGVCEEPCCCCLSSSEKESSAPAQLSFTMK